ncbi:MAG: hypothetical protein DRP72_00310 [Candidatus Omnitrophota bacterium]|nr:MAG: hypothetical protein DRP72_00310 [Candidatus Omnitrophota bacterium]
MKKKGIFVISEEIKKEITKLIFAWKEYLKEEVFYNSKARRFFTSLTITLSAWIGVVLLIWWIKSSVYAQQGGVLEGDSPLRMAFSWIMSGGIFNILLSFIRTNYRIFKRWFDFSIASLGLVIFSPLFLIIAILIKMDSQGSVFFRQERVGEGGKIFKIWKFRTMRANAELETGPVWAKNDDPRITRIGRFLRKSHLDELPQLINVFFGEMSLIGPRPERPEFVELIGSHLPPFYERLHIKPGITGLAQVRYRYGASIRDATRKLRYDLLYIKRMCWFLDFQIILWTVGKVFTGEGAR